MADFGNYNLELTITLLLLPAINIQMQSAAFRFLIECRSSD